MRKPAPPVEQKQLRPLRPVDDVFDRILSTVVDIDPETEAEEIKASLRLSGTGSGTDPSVMADALEESQDFARRAHALYCHVSLEIEQSAVDLRVLESTLRESASATLSEERGLEAEYDEKGKVSKKPKQVTEKDVAYYMDTHFTEDIRAIEAKRASHKLTIEHFEHLSRLCRDRTKTLEALVSYRRGRGTFDT
jgi:hypothetical protein